MQVSTSELDIFFGVNESYQVRNADKTLIISIKSIFFEPIKL